MTATEVVEEFLKLPIEEQQEAFQKIREVVEESDDQLSPEQVVELERRAEEARAHPERGIPWETVRDELYARYKVGQ